MGEYWLSNLPLELPHRCPVTQPVEILIDPTTSNPLQIYIKEYR